MIMKRYYETYHFTSSFMQLCSLKLEREKKHKRENFIDHFQKLKRKNYQKGLQKIERKE